MAKNRSKKLPEEAAPTQAVTSSDIQLKAQRNADDGAQVGPSDRPVRVYADGGCSEDELKCECDVFALTQS
jgi:hypothetical protein